jgi:hypothetical protein
MRQAASSGTCSHHDVLFCSRPKSNDPTGHGLKPWVKMNPFSFFSWLFQVFCYHDRKLINTLIASVHGSGNISAPWFIEQSSTKNFHPQIQIVPCWDHRKSITWDLVRLKVMRTRLPSLQTPGPSTFPILTCSASPVARSNCGTQFLQWESLLGFIGTL